MWDILIVVVAKWLIYKGNSSKKYPDYTEKVPGLYGEGNLAKKK